MQYALNLDSSEAMQYTLDIEVKPNYFDIGLYCMNTEEFFEAQLYNGQGRNALLRIVKKLASLTPADVVYTFFGISYDLPVMSWSLAETRTNEEIYAYSCQVIDADDWSYRMMRYLNFTHIDLAELLNLNRKARTEDDAGFVSLKKAAAILGFHTIRDFPDEPHLPLEAGGVKEMIAYRRNDNLVTAHLAKFAASEIEGRRVLQQALYPELDLITLGRPRVGKKALIQTYKDQTGANIYELNRNYWGGEPDALHKKMSSLSINFRDLLVMDYKFTTKAGKELYEKVIAFNRRMWYGTKKATSEHAFEAAFEIAGKRYVMREGGLHDDIGPGIWESNGQKLLNLDAKSFYPRIVEEYDVSPVYAPGFGKCIGVPTKYRLEAKAQAKKFEFGSENWKYYDDLAGALKIVVNAGVGQLGDMWSPFFDPRGFAKVTINGQLMLIMLIDWLSGHIGEIEVVQANTDGVAILCPNKLEGRLRKAVEHWEDKTRMTLEVEELGKLVKKNANAYMEIDTRGNVIKGAKEFNTIIEPGRSRSNEIIKKCLIAYYKEGCPPEKIMDECDDIHEFVTVVSARGATNYYQIDGMLEPGRMQKTLRYYQAQNGGSLGRLFRTAKNITSWPNASSVRVVLDIPDPRLKNFPDLDREWYVKKAKEAIADVLNV